MELSQLTDTQDQDILDRQGLKCTCHKYNLKCQNDSETKDVENNAADTSDVVPKKIKRLYGRSVSLGQIIPFQVHKPEDSPQLKTKLSQRELTDFEKDNLLFLKELQLKRIEQQQYLEKQVNELPYIAFPRRQSAKHKKAHRNILHKEAFPPTAFHPSKISSSEILRSISHEETEDDLDTSSEDSQTSVTNQLQNGFQDHEEEWKKLEDFLIQSGLENKSKLNSNHEMLSTKSKPIDDDDNNSRLSLKKMHILRSFSFPAKYNQHYVDEIWPEQEYANIQATSYESNPHCQYNHNEAIQNIYENIRSVKQWLNESIPDTTQRPVHETKNPKETEVTQNGKEPNTSNPSASKLASKPPSGQPPSQSSSILQSSSDGQNSPTADNTKKGSAMAFTVDFGDSGASDSSGSAGANKRLDISGPISQFAPKHKRNLSFNKVEEDKKVEERKIEKPPVCRPRSNTAGAGAVCSKRGGYHSEGYFSSDQEEEAARKADLKSPRTPRSVGLPSVNKSSLGESQKSNVLRARPDSPSNSYTVPLTESANFLIEKMLTATPELKRKSYGKPEGRSCCKDKKQQPMPELNGRLNRPQEKISSPKSDSGSSKRNSKSSPTFSDPSKDDKDDASDAGTYTIDKESPEVEAARNDIGLVFGVITESDAELTSSTAVPKSTTDVALDEQSWLSSSENRKQKVVPALSRNSQNWIQQWADSVAEQTKPAMKCVPSRSPVVIASAEKNNPTPQSSLHDNLDVRPRRKLPTPPQYPSPRSYPKENIFNADEQSTPKTKPKSSKSFRNYIECQESGGDSDMDFRSYSYTDDERLTASLRDKLRLTGLNASSPKNLPSPRRFDQLKGTQHNMIEEDFCGKISDNSDSSSSETSEQCKEPIRIPDNNPPLKFNRAFSLRRARLACDDPPKQVSVEKKASRPQSAGTGRKVPLAGTRAYQSVENSPVSSCRSFGGCGPLNSVVRGARQCNTARPLDCMIRNDGGRFSLRLSRSASSSAVKSPSKIIVKREPTSKKGPRSNSTLSAKEVDFQNWKRRKNYDPMKAAAEGRKKIVEKNINKGNDQSDLPSDSSPSPHNSLLRSASFHGTNGADMRWANKLVNHLQYTSEDDGPLSLEEEVPHRVISPLRRSPTSPKPMYTPTVRQRYTQGGSRVLRTPIESVEVKKTPHFQVSARKVSLDDSGSEGKRSPLNSQGSGRGNRPRTKMEALDNLVISTIHSLAVKVRTTAESLLLKLKSQSDEEGERAALLQEVLSHLSESDQSHSTQSRSTSRELAGILRNLKKIEHALQVVDRVMVAGLFIDEEDGEDIPNDWGESDY